MTFGTCHKGKRSKRRSDQTSGWNPSGEITWKSNIMSHEIRDYCKMDPSLIDLVFIEANTAHRFTLKIRRLFGIENSHNEIALQSALFCNSKCDRKTNSN